MPPNSTTYTTLPTTPHTPTTFSPEHDFPIVSLDARDALVVTGTYLPPNKRKTSPLCIINKFKKNILFIGYRRRSRYSSRLEQSHRHPSRNAPQRTRKRDHLISSHHGAPHIRLGRRTLDRKLRVRPRRSRPRPPEPLS
jgi:hypothetical protein